MKKTVELGFFLALSLILAYVESLIPFSFGLPGIKLCVPKLIVVMLLYRGDRKKTCPEQNVVSRSSTGQTDYGNVREALVVNMMRIVLSGFLFSNLYTIVYAMAGAFFSFTSMLIGRRLHCFSMVGVSVLGGVFHNIGQIIVAMLVVETFYVGYYIPFLIAAGTVTGAVLGIAAMELEPYLARYESTLKR